MAISSRTHWQFLWIHAHYFPYAHSVSFLVLCKWSYCIRMLTLKDLPGLLFLRKLCEPFCTAVLCYLIHWYCWWTNLYKISEWFSLSSSFHLFIYNVSFSYQLFTALWLLLGFIILLNFPLTLESIVSFELLFIFFLVFQNLNIQFSFTNEWSNITNLQLGKWGEVDKYNTFQDSLGINSAYLKSKFMM